MSEPTYTMAEARRQLALEECHTYGHDWDIIATIGTGPVRVICTRCGWSGDVTMRRMADTLADTGHRIE